MKYKKGDKVRVRKDLKPGYDYKVYCLSEMAKMAGREVTISEIDGDRYGDKYEIAEDSRYYWSEDMFVPSEKTLDDLEVGDILISFNDDEYMVLAVLGNIVFLSYINNFEWSGSYYTFSELKERGYRTKSEDEEKTPVELTVEEVSNRLGYEVKIVK